MAITAYYLIRQAHVTQVTVVSDLTPPVYYHWYLDGAWVGMTGVPVRGFALQTGDQVRLVCQDTTNAAYDPIANAPAGYPARRSLFWIRSLATDVAHYRVEQKRDTDAWVVLGTMVHADRTWHYTYLTPRLDDLTPYQWQVIPVDQAGNDGTALAIDSEQIVRTPDAPDYTIAFDGTDVTFTEAA